MPALPPVDLVVLAGGRGTRMGGRDKASIELGGRTLLERVLTADLGGRVVVVGETAVPDGVRRTVEDPPGGGPVAGIGAGLDALPWSQRAPSAAGDPSRPDWVAVELHASANLQAFEPAEVAELVARFVEGQPASASSRSASSGT